MNITKRGGMAHQEDLRVVTGFHSLDWAFADNLDNCGLPLRSIIEIAGGQGVGKSTLMFSLAGKVAAKLNRGILLADFERQNESTLSNCLELAGFRGDVEWETFEFSTDKKKKTKTADQIIDLVTTKCYDTDPNICLIDSLAAYQPEAVYDGDLEDANMGIKAKRTRQWFNRTLRPLIGNPKPTVVFFTNHVQPVIGGYRPNPNMPVPTESAGGTAVGYLSTQSIDLVKLYGYAYPEQNGQVLEGRVSKNRDGAGLMAKSKFFVYIQGGEGVNGNLTAVIDCVMYGLAESSSKGVGESSTITIDGNKKMGKFRDLIASRHDPELFTPFHNALQTVKGLKEISNEIGS